MDRLRTSSNYKNQTPSQINSTKCITIMVDKNMTIIDGKDDTNEHVPLFFFILFR